jgi:hypothetical protein
LLYTRIRPKTPRTSATAEYEVVNIGNANELFVGLDPAGDVVVALGVEDVEDAEPVAFEHATLEGMLKLSLKVKSAHCGIIQD